MRTLGRILIILFVFALVMGVTYTIVNASSPRSPANGPFFGRGEGDRREFPGAARPEGSRGEEEGEGRGLGFGLGMILGAIKNTAIIGVIVVAVVKFKDRMRKKKQDSQVTA